MARKSIQQAIDESNAWAKQQNAKSGYSGTNYMLNEYDPATGGYHSAVDPLRKQHDVVGFTPSTEAGATMWSSQYPGSAFWSPTKGGAWQELNEGMLSNPDAARAVMSGAGNTGSPSFGAFSQLKGKIPASVIQGIQGSSNSLAPEVLAKMWK
jgi:hypothetical protein